MIYKFKEYQETPIIKNHLRVGGSDNKGNRIDVTSRYFTKNDVPCLDVMAEFHFSRCDRNDWKDRLSKMKAGGITIVASYLFWIYHEETEGIFDFSGDLDIRAFVKTCQEVGLDVVIRIGPWAHGECRNGGFPDWLLKKPFKLRDNNEGYMDLARIWYEKIFEQVQGLFYKDGGNIIGVQFENELVNNAEHLLALKELALEIGYEAPLYTVTGWNSLYGAKIPVDEVVPVFAAYPDAPWAGTLKQLPPSPHYVFNQMRNDTAVGVDLIKTVDEDGWRLPYERYPFATCELGGGMQVSHHRRPWVKGMDVYALSLVKLGSGNNLIGYYMYCGGTNKIGKYSTFNENKATGYPNDYTILSYDFQAPLSEYGETREQYRLLNMLHMFAKDFGDYLAPMEAVDSTEKVYANDFTSLRYSMRTDGNRGFIFVNHYQRLAKMQEVNDAVIDTGVVTFPAINVKDGVSFFMPFMMPLGTEVLEYATAQPLCKCGNTVFFAQVDGIPAEYKFAGKETVCAKAGLRSAFMVGDIKIVTLTWEQAVYTRKLGEKVYVGEGCDLYLYDEVLKVSQDGVYTYYVWDGSSFVPGQVGSAFEQPKIIVEVLEEAPFDPEYMEELTIGGPRNIVYSKVSVTGSEGFVEISDQGDVLQMYVKDGSGKYTMVADNYYYGAAWRLPARLLYGKDCFLVVSEMKDDFYREF